MAGWLENLRVMLISAFNSVEVEVEAELGKISNQFMQRLGASLISARGGS